MSIPVLSSLRDRYELLESGQRLLELLTLDDLWTEAASEGDSAAPEIGRRMLQLIEQLRLGTGQVERLILGERVELNAYWPELRRSWGTAGEPEVAALDQWVEQYGGLGDAGVSAASLLHGALEEEGQLIAAKVAELEAGSQSTGDLSRQKKILIGVTAVCCLAVVALPAVGAAVAAGGIAAGLFSGAAGLAGVAAGISGAAILTPEAGPA